MSEFIKIVKGDLLQATEDIVCHQVNAQGVMGSGLAKDIKKHYPEAFERYRALCLQENKGRHLLGTCQIIKSKDKYIANIFGQHKFGRDGVYTEMDALKQAFYSLKMRAQKHNLSIAIPFKFGCGLAGGDWNEVFKLIEETFRDYHFTIYIKED
ncbi:macro domain-containing protein [Bacillus thuringiensis]|uniref:Appr-1-p processing protein n=1 Tax=Bacillus thuringiensis TaxID=1428 RepID=A0A9X6VCS4_BACTU|nr:macro domain-containing protein [Bacillus thuringiensis]MCU5279696.1 macro domain-containing protein [Bacillus cereus]MEC3270702.1 macro domain-containing protein [Bacillus thuringiensis]PFB08072.1 Appr-1-p processing protein [Bacillus thuringiensis]